MIKYATVTLCRANNDRTLRLSSLPQRWIDDMGYKAGDKIVLYLDTAHNLIIRPKPAEAPTDATA